MLFGQSAGSGSTGFHVASERSAGLFHAFEFLSFHFFVVILVVGLVFFASFFFFPQI